MSDFIYVLVTVVSFGLLAVLVGVLDRWLARADDLDDPQPAVSSSANPAASQ